MSLSIIFSLLVEEFGTYELFPAQHLLRLVLTEAWSGLVVQGVLVTHQEEETALGLNFFVHANDDRCLSLGSLLLFQLGGGTSPVQH